jgi:hypothetical protein
MGGVSDVSRLKSKSAFDVRRTDQSFGISQEFRFSCVKLPHSDGAIITKV